MTESNDRFPNIFQAIGLVVALIAAEFLIAIALQQSSLLDSMDWQGASVFITVLGNGLLFVCLLHYKRLSYRSLFHASTNSVAATLSTLCIPILLIIPGVAAYASAFTTIVERIFPMTNQDREVLSRMTEMSAIPVFFACVGAPILEEMLFRGVIMRSFLRQYSRTSALVWSSLLFAAAHLNLYQFFTALILGVALGWLYERTRSLWPSIFLHAAYNTYVVLAVNSSVDAGVPTNWTMGSALVVGILGALLLLRILEPTKAAARQIDRDPRR